MSLKNKHALLPTAEIQRLLHVLSSKLLGSRTMKQMHVSIPNITGKQVHEFHLNLIQKQVNKSILRSIQRKGSRFIARTTRLQDSVSVLLQNKCNGLIRI